MFDGKIHRPNIAHPDLNGPKCLKEVALYPLNHGFTMVSFPVLHLFFILHFDGIKSP
jgi:hypothetical protein